MTPIPIELEGECFNFWSACYLTHPTLQRYPLLAALVMRGCMELRLTPAEQHRLSASNEVEYLLQSVGLPRHSALWALLIHVTQVNDKHPLAIRSVGLAAVYQEIRFERLTTLPLAVIPQQLEDVVDLACLLARFPLLYQGRLLRRPRRPKDYYSRLLASLERTVALAEKLGHTDIEQRLCRCRHLKDTSSWSNRVNRAQSREIQRRLQGHSAATVDEVLARIGDVLFNYERRVLKQAWTQTVAPVPLPDSDQIQQLIHYRDIFLEAHTLQHCGETYWPDIRDGAMAMFRVLAPQRATLVLAREAVDQPFRLSELVGHYNRRVSQQTWKAVRAWFHAAQSRVPRCSPT